MSGIPASMSPNDGQLLLKDLQDIAGCKQVFGGVKCSECTPFPQAPRTSIMRASNA